MSLRPPAEEPPQPAPPATAPTGAAGHRARVDSRTLLAGRAELLIAHGDEEYRLRVTRQGKLILTK